MESACLALSRIAAALAHNPEQVPARCLDAPAIVKAGVWDMLSSTRRSCSGTLLTEPDKTCTASVPQT